MTRKIVAISGGENGRQLENGKFTLYETGPMDMEIVRLAEKEKPNFLFMAQAQYPSIKIEEDYYQTMKKIYGEKFECNCQNLKSSDLGNKEIVQEKINWADIIYEGGGDTLTMLNLWKKYGIDKILYEAWNNGKVISGISAGAECWFKAASEENLTIQEAQEHLANIECLNWFNLYFTPHGDEWGIYEITKAQLKQNGLVGILLSNCAALEIVDNKYRIIISDSKGYNFNKAYALKTYWNENKYIEEKVEISSKFQDISELLSKN